MNEAEKESVKKEAMKILENFSKSLGKVKLKEKKVKKEEGGYRTESVPEKQDLDFRKRMFANAPESDGECIIAEKKSW